jgi:type I restriction enzyme S subunit
LSIKKNDLVSYIEMSDLSTDSMCINNFIRRPFSAGSKFQNDDTLLARITPCLENGKTGFVNFLNENEIAFGSTEFIVMRARKDISPYWIYCLAKDEDYRSYAISSMVGSSGRERVHENYLKHYLIKELDYKVMSDFNNLVKPIFEMIGNSNIQRQKLESTKNLLLSKLANINK